MNIVRVRMVFAFLMFFGLPFFLGSTIVFRVLDQNGVFLNYYSLSVKSIKNGRVRNFKVKEDKQVEIKNISKGLWRLRVFKKGYYPTETFFYFNPNVNADLNMKISKFAINFNSETEKTLERGIEYFIKWKDKKAISMFDKVLKDYKDPELMKVNALLFYSLKKYEKAIQILKDIKNQDIIYLQIFVSSLLKINDYKNALKFLNKIAPKKISNPFISTEIGGFYYEREEYEKAVPFLERSIKIYPDNPESYYFLGLSFAALDKRKLAIENLKKFIKMDPDSANTVIADSVIRTLKDLYKEEKNEKK